MSQSLSRRSFLRYAGTGAVTLAAALLGGGSAAAQDTPCLRGEPADAPGLGGTLVYLSAENLSAHTLPVAPSYLQGRAIQTQEELYHTGSGLSVCCDGQPVPCGSFAAPLYNENAADASLFTLNLAAGRGAMIHCFCKTPDDWQQLELRYQPAFAAGQSVCFAVRRGEDAAALGPVPASPAELATLVDL